MYYVMEIKSMTSSRGNMRSKQDKSYVNNTCKHVSAVQWCGWRVGGCGLHCGGDQCLSSFKFLVLYAFNNGDRLSSLDDKYYNIFDTFSLHLQLYVVLTNYQ